MDASSPMTFRCMIRRDNITQRGCAKNERNHDDHPSRPCREINWRWWWMKVVLISSSNCFIKINHEHYRIDIYEDIKIANWTYFSTVYSVFKTKWFHKWHLIPSNFLQEYIYCSDSWKHFDKRKVLLLYMTRYVKIEPAFKNHWMRIEKSNHQEYKTESP